VEHTNGASGAIYIGNLAHGKVRSTGDHVSVGQQITARILNFDDKKQQIELSIKALLPKPYEGFKNAHSIGEVVAGVVTGMNMSFTYV
jgi:small subunit ribosomal protein S1